MRVGFLAASALAGSIVVACTSSAHDGTAEHADTVVASPVFTPIATGGNHTCSVARRGIVCWGINASGQLNVPALRHPTQVVAGSAHVCALDDDGVKCWGLGNNGQTTPPALRNPRQVRAGTNHTCAIDDDGVKCWGLDAGMQTDVPPLRQPTQIAAGGSHTCAIDADGVKCWGKNVSGHITVPPLKSPTQIAAGDSHTCAVDADGVKCWGLGASMQTTVPPLRNPTQVTAGGLHTCALDADGVKCWGANAQMQTVVPALTRPTWISAGRNHTCALDDEQVKCWGSDSNGQATPPIDFALVGSHSCALVRDRLRCTGDNEHGQLGIGSDQDLVVSLGAAKSTDLGAAFGSPVQIVVGSGFGCALDGAGDVKCWGSNGHGHLGLGDDRDRGIVAGEMGDALPTLRFGRGGPIAKIAAGQDHACALGKDGALFCWGKGSSGQLGNEAAADVGAKSDPVQPRLKPGISVRDVALGRAHTCVLGSDAAIYCFGGNEFGQLGLGRTGAVGDRAGTMGSAMQPVALGDGFEPKALSSGDDHVCALSTDGRVKCWGAAASGQLGLGDTRDRGDSEGDLGAALPAVDVGHGQFVVDVSCGKRHACVRTIQNTMKCWGENSDGQLGLGDLVDRGGDASSIGDDLPFVATPPQERVFAIEAVFDRTCARTESGLRCWGRNRSGELGYGDRDGRGGSPTTVPRALPPIGL